MALVSGLTGSGKTVFVRQFIHRADMVDPVPDEVIYCYGEYQEIFKEMPIVQFIEGFPYMDKWMRD